MDQHRRPYIPMVSAIREFAYTAPTTRVIFGAGAIRHLAREIEMLGAHRALVLCTPEQAREAERIATYLGSSVAGIYAKAVMHVPIDTVREARATALRLGADCAVAIGGGSTTGLGKAIALESGLPILAIPTTYAGSEMTPIFGLTEGRMKRTGRDPRVLPRSVIYDPELTLSLPLGLTLTSSMNAIAHAVEGLYSKDGNPIMDLMAEEGIRALAGAMPKLKLCGQDLDARSMALYGAWLCGTVLGNVGMALHHKLCHTLGGTFGLPHAEVHTIILPHVVAYNAPAIGYALLRINRALGSKDAAGALYDLARDNGAPFALRDIGMPASDIAEAANIAVANPYWNPRPIERDEVYALLQHAWEGRRPE